MEKGRTPSYPLANALVAVICVARVAGAVSLAIRTAYCKAREAIGCQGHAQTRRMLCAPTAGISSLLIFAERAKA
jgi:hypothetical protein